MRPLVRTALLIGFLADGMSWALGTPTLPQLQRATGYCRKAESAMKSGNLKGAREALTKALKILPTLPAVHLGMGHIALSEKRYEDALREYEIARDSYADVARALYALHVRDYADAQYEIVALQDEIRNQQRLAPVALRLNRLEAAADRLERLDPPSRTAPEDPPAEIFFYIGNALFHLDRLREAVSAWETCIRKNREFPPAYQNLAVGYWMTGRPEAARQIVAAADKLGFALNADLRADLQRSLAGP